MSYLAPFQCLYQCFGRSVPYVYGTLLTYRGDVFAVRRPRNRGTFQRLYRYQCSGRNVPHFRNVNYLSFARITGLMLFDNADFALW